MAVYMVSYDLHGPDHAYDKLWEALQSYSHDHSLESVWFIDTLEEVATILDQLTATLQDKIQDQVFVGQMKKHWATKNINELGEWLKSPNRRWG